MKQNEDIIQIDINTKDNLNKEKALNDLRKEKNKKSKNITLAVTLTFLGLTATTTALFIAGAIPVGIGSSVALIGAMATATSASLFAKKNSAYKNCIAQQEYFTQAEEKIAQRKAAELKRQQEEKERKIKEQKEKQARRKGIKQLAKEGKVKVASKYKCANRKASQFSNSSKRANTKKPATAVADKKNEQIKDINSFLDSGK